jgi:hypothetical protein
VPDTFRVTSTRLEAAVGDRLAPLPQQRPGGLRAAPPDAADRRPHRLDLRRRARAGQNQIVALNRGKRATASSAAMCWRCGAPGRPAVDRTAGSRTPLQLPDEQHGLLFVFRVFERVSYALILSVQEPVRPGDRFTQP